MPIYEYRCDACGEDLEVTQRITADKLVDCPACDEPKLRRLISRTSFMLKGSGWYATDYAGKGKDKAKDKDHGKSDKGGDAGSSSASNGGSSKSEGSSGGDTGSSKDSGSSGASASGNKSSGD